MPRNPVPGLARRCMTYTCDLSWFGVVLWYGVPGYTVSPCARCHNHPVPHNSALLAHRLFPTYPTTGKKSIFRTVEPPPRKPTMPLAIYISVPDYSVHYNGTTLRWLVCRGSRLLCTMGVFEAGCVYGNVCDGRLCGGGRCSVVLPRVSWALPTGISGLGLSTNPRERVVRAMSNA